MIVVHEISGPQLALLSEAQDIVRRFIAEQTSWSKSDRQVVDAVFAEVEER